jgi:hypothetical protein
MPFQIILRFVKRSQFCGEFTYGIILDCTIPLELDPYNHCMELDPYNLNFGFNKKILIKVLDIFTICVQKLW